MKIPKKKGDKLLLQSKLTEKIDNEKLVLQPRKFGGIRTTTFHQEYVNGRDETLNHWKKSEKRQTEQTEHFFLKVKTIHHEILIRRGELIGIAIFGDFTNSEEVIGVLLNNFWATVIIVDTSCAFLFDFSVNPYVSSADTFFQS